MQDGSTAPARKMDGLDQPERHVEMALIAALGMHPRPLDVVLTDGTTYILWRARGKYVMVYRDLNAEEVHASSLPAALLCTAYGPVTVL